MEDFFRVMKRMRLPLPGIGRYTAAAILSIAYGAKHAVLDGNVGSRFGANICRAGRLARREALAIICNDPRMRF